MNSVVYMDSPYKSFQNPILLHFLLYAKTQIISDNRFYAYSPFGLCP